MIKTNLSLAREIFRVWENIRVTNFNTRFANQVTSVNDEFIDLGDIKSQICDIIIVYCGNKLL